MIQLKCKLKEILQSRQISQKELSAMTGLREATISEMVNDIRISYNRKYLEVIMQALEITDVSEIIETINEKGIET